MVLYLVSLSDFIYKAAHYYSLSQCAL